MNCTEFEAEVLKDVSYEPECDGLALKAVTRHIVTCKNRARCKVIYDCMRKDIEKELIEKLGFGSNDNK